MAREVRIQTQSEWHAWRAGGVGGSDAPAIMGVSPFDTYESLLLQKTGIGYRKEKTGVILRGIAFEQVARTKYEKLTGNKYEPGYYLHDDMHWMRVSVDGYSKENNEVIEIKCPGVTMYKKYVSYGPPLYYIIQMLHTSIVMQPREITFILLYRNDLHYHKVSSDDRFVAVCTGVKDKLLSQEKMFYDEFVALRDMYIKGEIDNIVRTALGRR